MVPISLTFLRVKRKMIRWTKRTMKPFASYSTLGEKKFCNSKHGQRKLYLDHIEAFSNDKSLASQSRFIYKYLIGRLVQRKQVW